MAETINYVNRSRAFMPPGTVSPFVMRFDTGSVPVGYLVLSSETQIDRRDPGPGPVQGAADVRELAGRVGSAAVRRQPAHGRRTGRSGAAAVLRDVAGRGDLGPDQGQHDQPFGQHADRQTIPDRADQFARARRPGPGHDPAAARSNRRRSTCATWRPSKTPATSPPVMRSSTAGGRFTSW